jgi:predicted Zn-dependent protease
MLVAVIASGGNADVAQAAVAVGASAAAQTQINFTRAHEHEADRLGIRTLASAGYDPGGMASFFEKLDQQTRLYGDTVPEMLRSHPVNVNRISEARSRAASFPPAKPRPEATDVDRYGLASAQLRSGQPDAAVKTFRTLAEKDRAQAHYLLGWARAQLSSSRPEDALPLLERGHSLFPDNPAVAAVYAEALLRFKRPSDARRVILSTSGALNGEVPEMQRLLAVTAQELGWHAEALFRMGEYHELLGDYASAYNQYEAALRLPNLSTNDKARLDSKIEALKKEAPEEAKAAKRRGNLRRPSR